MKVSRLATNITGSEIIKLAAEVNEKIGQGQKIYNLTIGDFDPQIFPIPEELKEYIVEEYHNKQTNYPAAEGVLPLRQAVREILKKFGGLEYSDSQILIAGGARPLIYSVFRTLVDPGDTVIFGAPSWNNNHYSYLNGAEGLVIETDASMNFMPSAEQIRPHIGKASLIALCSPQNPTGTVFSKEGLAGICRLIIEENKKRGADQKPVYLMYDQIYWALTMEGTEHYDPVSLYPEMRPFTVYVDGLSKSLAATGVRIGWSMGPAHIIGKMKAILMHIGAWAPKAEQVAAARYLKNLDSYSAFIEAQKKKIAVRLNGFYEGIQSLKKEGFNVDAVSPQAAIYLTVKFGLHGYKTENGTELKTTRDVTSYLLNEASLAIVPFYAFGASESSEWYRLSIGTCKEEDIEKIMDNLRSALKKLKN